MVSLKAAFVHESACTSCWFVELRIAEPTDFIQEQLQQFLLCLTNWPSTQNKVGHEQVQAYSSVKKSHLLCNLYVVTIFATADFGRLPYVV